MISISDISISREQDVTYQSHKNVPTKKHIKITFQTCNGWINRLICWFRH